MSASKEELQSVTGVQLAQGIGHKPTQGFWAEAWAQVLTKWGALIGIGWVAIIAFFAIFAPLIASGHPLIMWEIGEGGEKTMSSPLVDALSGADVVLLAWGLVVPIFLMLPMIKLTRSERLRILIAGGLQSAVITVLAGVMRARYAGIYVSDEMREFEQSAGFVPKMTILIAVISIIPFLFIAIWVYKSWWRSSMVVMVAIVVALLVGWKWSPTLPNFDYRALQASGEIEAVYTLVPYSPSQGSSTMYNREPGATPMFALWEKFENQMRLDNEHRAMYSDEQLSSMVVDEAVFARLRSVAPSLTSLMSEPVAGVIEGFENAHADGSIPTLIELKGAITEYKSPGHFLGTDVFGQDVLSQMLHACRLSISIGLVSTSIAVTIGVVVGAIMGYFGGIIDLLLYRVVEVFMAIPVLFLLIVAAGVLPRNIYIMMAIIGCFTWTGAARFVRAEFMKLRNVDYIQSARAMGLPLRSILFKHMLPNGVTPVLVEASFAIAAAILIEATLSYLGLGPANQASWGLLLSNATGDTGAFVWWLAIFPGGAIFLTALAYNLIGEALRDAVDPKLKKARV
ncbi:MAG: ABC transporter permease [Phycisphaerales bacterium]|nr:ABC transporter permease [Phycisphaerales bacterium]